MPPGLEKTTGPRLDSASRAILVGLYRDILHLRSLAAPDKCTYRHWRTADAHKGIVALDITGWLGGDVSGAERRAASRGLGRLESAGLIERLREAGGVKTTSVRITPAGELLAETLLPKSED